MMLAIVAEYETWQDAQRRLEPWVRGSQRVGPRNDEPESDSMRAAAMGHFTNDARDLGHENSFAATRVSRVACSSLLGLNPQAGGRSETCSTFEITGLAR